MKVTHTPDSRNGWLDTAWLLIVFLAGLVIGSSQQDDPAPPTATHRALTSGYALRPCSPADQGTPQIQLVSEDR